MKNLAEKIEALTKRRGKYDVMLKQLERTGEDQISLTDPDSRAMAARTRVAVGCNVQVAIDAKKKMIVEQQVNNQVVDMGLLQATAESAWEILDVETIDIVADAGSFRTEDIAPCEEEGPTRHVLRPQRGSSADNGFFRKDEFRYDANRNAYACLGGHELKPFRHGKLREMTKTDYADKRACRECPLRGRRLSRRLAAGARGRARPHGGSPEGQAGPSRHSARDRRTPVRDDQAMNESRRIPGA